MYVAGVVPLLRLMPRAGLADGLVYGVDSGVGDAAGVHSAQLCRQRVCGSFVDRHRGGEPLAQQHEPDHRGDHIAAELHHRLHRVRGVRVVAGQQPEGPRRCTPR